MEAAAHSLRHLMWAPALGMKGFFTQTLLQHVGIVGGVGVGGGSLVYAAVLLGTGFARRLAALRWSGLAIFLVTLVKVFFVDMAQLPTAHRIGGFLVLGLLLLGASFLYQRSRRES